MFNYLKYIVLICLSFVIISCGNNLDNEEFQYPEKINIEFLHEINNGFRNGEGSFLNIKNNTLAYVYTCFNEGVNDASNADICIIKSSDTARKIWTSPEILIQNHGVENIMSVSLLRKDDNSILIQYLEKNSCNDLKVMRRYSFDELKTVSDIFPLETKIGYNVVNNDRLLYSKGFIYTPISRHSCKDNIFVYSGIMELAITDKNNVTNIVSISHDSNTTLQEPGIVNLDHNGKNLLMWFRNNTTKMFISKSTYLDLSFMEPYPSVLNTIPYSPSSIKLFNDNLFIVYNRWSSETIGQKRTPLVLAISKDGLKTIYKEYTLEESSLLEYMYTSIHRDNNSLILAYMIQYGSDFRLKIVKIDGLLI